MIEKEQKFNTSRSMRLYGIDSMNVWDMMEKQKIECKICGNSIFYKWCVDHNHKTGEVRGILCGLCNSMLGFARDNPLILIKGVEYLKGG